METKRKNNFDSVLEKLETYQVSFCLVGWCLPQLWGTLFCLDQRNLSLWSHAAFQDPSESLVEGNSLSSVLPEAFILKLQYEQLCQRTENLEGKGSSY
jgi:hypothetical protein